MADIILKIIFFLFILPYLMAEKAYHMLNAYLEKQGRRKVDLYEVALAALVFLLILLWVLGYR